MVGLGEEAETAPRMAWMAEMEARGRQSGGPWRAAPGDDTASRVDGDREGQSFRAEEDTVAPVGANGGVGVVFGCLEGKFRPL